MKKRQTYKRWVFVKNDRYGDYVLRCLRHIHNGFFCYKEGCSGELQRWEYMRPLYYSDNLSKKYQKYCVFSGTREAETYIGSLPAKKCPMPRCKDILSIGFCWSKSGLVLFIVARCECGFYYEDDFGESELSKSNINSFLDRFDDFEK